ncbi:MAG TPA: hypothetical protein VFV38_15755, partial [Ktedonobacteraceae bacterium]|nr:hypothetical protein [Ktedonobacteraceae bacterium]
MENWPHQVPPDSSYPPTQPGYMAPPHSSSAHISEQTPSAYAPPSIYPYESVSHIQPPRRLKNPLWVALIAAVIVLG